MGVLDKFLDAIKINDDYDDDDFFDDDFEDEVETGSVRKKFTDKFKRDRSDDYYDEVEEPVKPARTPRPQTSSKITPMRASKRAGTPVEVNIIKPSTMEDTKKIADTLLNSCTAIINLEGIDVELAQRIIDFTSGSCYSLNGRLQVISSYIFIATPDNVDLSGDYQELVNGSLPSLRSKY
ncbi:MAG: cell division protein SepF [Lachnospiraceae bacterium]